MKRVLFSLAAVLALTLVVVATTHAQESSPSTDQSATGATTQQPATQTPTSTSDQPATTTSDAGSSMPATAGPLPLIGMGGLASLAAGALLSRRRRRD